MRGNHARRRDFREIPFEFTMLLEWINWSEHLRRSLNEGEALSSRDNGGIPCNELCRKGEIGVYPDSQEVGLTIFRGKESSEGDHAGIVSGECWRGKK